MSQFRVLKRFLSSTVKSPPTSNLLSQLKAKIKLTGPISVADYMKEVLTNPIDGYYMSQTAIGAKGDFITSPEISQIFGELIGIWCINEWQQMGCPPHMQVVELGPGRGTLAHDILRVFSQFPQIKDKISFHLVEVSPKMMQLQCRKLTMSEGLMSPTEQVCMKSQTKSGMDVLWYQNLQDVPSKFSCYIAHEFFDALPIYKFQKTDSGWREVLVSIDNKTENLNFALAHGPTAASKTILPELPKSDHRLHVEVSPQSAITVQHLSERIHQHGGMALIADYGHNGEKGDTFRAFKNHQLHDPLIEPGSADLTADVDFSYLKQNLHDKVISYGPITQADFLHNMGIEYRMKVLYENANSDQRRDLISGFDMLTNPEKMGERFKFFSVFPDSVLKKGYTPAGFVSLT